MQDVKSSNIKSIGYSPKRKYLDVEFLSGDIYRYKNVPKEEHKNFMSSNSKGKYLNSNIKGNGYRYKKRVDRDGNLTKDSWKTPIRKTASEYINLLYEMAI